MECDRGGFTAGQQLTVYQQIAGPLRGVLDPVRRAKGGGGIAPNELTELLRLVGSLELLRQVGKNAVGTLVAGPLNRQEMGCLSVFRTLGHWPFRFSRARLRSAELCRGYGRSVKMARRNVPVRG